MDIMSSITENVIAGNRTEVIKFCNYAVANGEKPIDILSFGLMPGMDSVGSDFRAGMRFVPEVLVSAHAMHAGMQILKPYLIKNNFKPVGRYVIGTVQGDIHDIGKNLVAMLLEGAGFEVFDLGVDITPDKFLEALKAKQPDIIGISALLSTTMLGMHKVIELIEESGYRKNVKIMVGGAPVTEEYSKKIKADAYAPEACSAVEVARDLVRSY